MKDLASSRLDSIKRQLDRSHSEILKDIEAFQSRLHKRFKVLVRNVPPDPDESVGQLVEYFFLVLGFTERNEAFDFNVALSDHEKHVKREDNESGKTSEDNFNNIHPAVNQRLKVAEFDLRYVLAL